MRDFEQWRDELIFYGRIVQDEDTSVSPDESERRFNKYIEMLDQINGDEGPKYALAIFESIQSVHDYGAYQTTGSTAWKFGHKLFCQSLVHELPRLIKELPDWAGDFLGQIANSKGTDYQNIIAIFNEVLASSNINTRNLINKFIREQENNGWLKHKAGVLYSRA